MSVYVDEAALSKAGIKYLGLKLDDAPEQEIGSKFQETGDWINEAITSDDNSKVLINCWAGISRSSTIATAYLVNVKILLLFLNVLFSSLDETQRSGFAASSEAHQVSEECST